MEARLVDKGNRKIINLWHSMETGRGKHLELEKREIAIRSRQGEGQK